MKKRLILHIGRHKTGTTSIQRSLLNNRQLLALWGVHYPTEHMRGPGQHEFGKGVTLGSHWTLALKDKLYQWRSGRKPVARSSAPRDKAHNPHAVLGRKELLAYRDRLLQVPGDTVVISSEALQGADPRYVQLLLKDFDVEPVCYLREQVAYLRSAYAQHVQSTEYTRTPAHFYRYHFHVNYWFQINRWRKVFGRRCHFRIFEPGQLTNGNVLDDFLQNILQLRPDQREQLVPAPAENPSLSHDMLSLKLALNRGPFLLSHRLYGVLADMSRDAQPYRLQPAMAQRVLSDCQQSNRRAAQLLLQRDALFTQEEPCSDRDLEISADELRRWASEANERDPGVIRFA